MRHEIPNNDYMSHRAYSDIRLVYKQPHRRKRPHRNFTFYPPTVMECLSLHDMLPKLGNSAAVALSSALPTFFIAASSVSALFLNAAIHSFLHPSSPTYNQAAHTSLSAQFQPTPVVRPSPTRTLPLVVQQAPSWTCVSVLIILVLSAVVIGSVHCMVLRSHTKRNTTGQDSAKRQDSPDLKKGEDDDDGNGGGFMPLFYPAVVRLTMSRRL